MYMYMYMYLNIPLRREGSGSTLYLLGVGTEVSIGLEGVAGREDEGTLGGSEGGTESGGLSGPVRDFTLDTARKERQIARLCDPL